MMTGCLLRSSVETNLDAREICVNLDKVLTERRRVKSGDARFLFLR